MNYGVKCMSDEDPRLEITIELSDDDPLGLHSFIREVPWFNFVDEFEATLIESDGTERDVKEEAFEGK